MPASWAFATRVALDVARASLTQLELRTGTVPLGRAPGRNCAKQAHSPEGVPEVMRSPVRTRPSARNNRTGPAFSARPTARLEAPEASALASSPAKADPLDESGAPILTSRRRGELRAESHHLSPIVHVGHEGLHGSVFDAVRRALRDHALIKVRLHEPEDKRAMAEALATETRAALCGLVGHTVILYKPKKPASRKPRPVS